MVLRVANGDDRAVLVRLGHRITARRTWLGMGVGTLSALVGFRDRSSLHNYETGKHDPPTTTLHRIAHALDTTSTDLLGEKLTPDAERDAHIAMALLTDPVVAEILRRVAALDQKGRMFALALLRVSDRYGIHKGQVRIAQERLAQQLAQRTEASA